MVKNLVTKEEVDGFLGIDTQINSSENPLEESVEILTDLINGEYSVDQLRRDMQEWKDIWTVAGTKERPAPMPAMSPFEPEVDIQPLQFQLKKYKANVKNIYRP